jgi:hypothetical protein
MSVDDGQEHSAGGYISLVGYSSRRSSSTSVSGLSCVSKGARAQGRGAGFTERAAGRLAGERMEHRSAATTDGSTERR